MVIELLRCYENDHGMFGMFIAEKKIVCVSLEKKWSFNMRNVSCIPTGTYNIDIISHPKFGRCFRVLDVPERDGILIHPANKESELRGCIAPGLAYRADGVSHSRLGLERLLALKPTVLRIEKAHLY